VQVLATFWHPDPRQTDWVGFFTQFRTVAAMPEFDEEPRPEPEWFGPPRGVIPGRSIQRVVLFRTEKAILWLGRFDAYPTGVEFEIEVNVRDFDNDLDHMPWELHHRRSGRRGGSELPDDFLRLGLAFADGQVWSNAAIEAFDWQARPNRPVVMSQGGGGGGGRWKMHQWMWPLPPDGDLTFYAEWPALGISEVSASIDATELRQRAAESETLWQ
jgi:hypothetical protein